MAMKVCKLVRLAVKDEKGNFDKAKASVTVRSRVVVDESSVKETEENYKQSGLLYVVDEKATKERDAKIEEQLTANNTSGNQSHTL
jgi:hypothetical protein